MRPCTYILLFFLITKAIIPFHRVIAQDRSHPGFKERVEEREQLVRRGIENYPYQPVTDTRVLKAMRSVPRHLFVPPEYRDLAYRNSPLSIGYEQTISQPFIVALITLSTRSG